MASLFDTRTLAKVVDSFDRPTSFLLDTFFPEMVLFDTEYVDIDQLERSQGLAFFIQRGVPSHVDQARGYTTRSYRPPYVKPKNRVDPSKPLRRRPGERPSGELSASERAEAIVADLLLMQRNKIIRRKELMAAQALLSGGVTVAGDLVTDETISFGRNAGHSVVLSGANRWGQAGISPMDNLETWAATVANNSGVTPTDVVFGPVAWSHARADSKLIAALDTLRATDSNMMELAPVNGDMGVYLGRAGMFRFWLYSAQYTDESGASQKYLPSNGVIMASPNIDGVQAHGAVEDPLAGYQAMEVFPRDYISDDPPGRYVMSQSAPLVVPGNPNATLGATVA